MIPVDDDHHRNGSSKYQSHDDDNHQHHDVVVEEGTKTRQLNLAVDEKNKTSSSSSPVVVVIDENDYFSVASKSQQDLEQKRVSIFGDDSNQIISLVPVPVIDDDSKREDAETRRKYFHCVVGSEEGDMALYCPKTRKVLSSSKPHKNEIMHLKYNMKSRFVYAASRDKTISLHQITTSNSDNNNDDDDHQYQQQQQPGAARLQMKHRLEGHTLSVTAIDINQEDPAFLVSGSRDNTVRLWDCNAGRCVDVADVKLNIVHCVKWIPALQLVAQGGEDLAIRLWDVRCGGGNGGGGKLDLVDTLLGFDYHPICCDIVNADGGHVLVVGHNGFNDTGSTISFWDLRMRRLLRHCEGHSNTVRRICCSQTTSHIVTGSDDQTMKLWRGEGYPEQQQQQQPESNNNNNNNNSEDMVSNRSNNSNSNNNDPANVSGGEIEFVPSGNGMPPVGHNSTQSYGSCLRSSNNNSAGTRMSNNATPSSPAGAAFAPVMATEYVPSRIAALSSFVHPDDPSRREVIIAAFRSGEISTWSVANEKLSRLRYLA